MGDEKHTADTTDDTEGHAAKWRGAPMEAQDASGHTAKAGRLEAAGAEDDGDDTEGHKTRYRP